MRDVIRTVVFFLGASLGLVTLATGWQGGQARPVGLCRERPPMDWLAGSPCDSGGLQPFKSQSPELPPISTGRLSRASGQSRSGAPR